MITSLCSLQDIYNKGREKFTPDSSNNPDNTWFYASWFGMKAVCQILEIDIENLHYAMHRTICTSRGDWKLLLEDLRKQNETIIYPEKPREHHHYDYEPTFGEEDIEKRAREIFASQFKLAFPNKKINTILGKAKWKEVADKAKEIAQEELQNTHNMWEKREEKRKQELEKQTSQWQTHCDNINELKSTIQKILDETERKEEKWYQE